jgi:hypothetical protein
MLHSDMYVKFKIGKDLTSEFKVNKCLRQEEEIAPLLLNIVLEIAIRRSKVETRVNIFDKCRQIIAYPDDVLLWEKDYKIFKEYLHHWSKIQIRWDYK